MVIAVDNAQPRLRGRLAAWLIEIRAGVYVGNYGRKTREMIWKQVETYIGQGDGVMVWSSPNDQGYEFFTIGHNRRMPVDFDGMTLVTYSPRKP